MKICETVDCGRPATRLAFVEDADPPDWFDYCEECAAVLNRVDGADVKVKIEDVEPLTSKVALAVRDLCAENDRLYATATKYRKALESVATFGDGAEPLVMGPQWTYWRATQDLAEIAKAALDG